MSNLPNDQQLRKTKNTGQIFSEQQTLFTDSAKFCRDTVNFGKLGSCAH